MIPAYDDISPDPKSDPAPVAGSITTVHYEVECLSCRQRHVADERTDAVAAAIACCTTTPKASS